MKKALFTLLLFCLGIFISACGGGGGSSASGYSYIPVVTEPEEVPNNNQNNNQNNPQHEVSPKLRTIMNFII